ncbi:MAG: AAA family ATPase, partial [Desulfobulbia bacterium]
SSKEYVYHAKTSNNASDGNGSYMKQQIRYGKDEVIYDHIFVSKVLSNTSMRAIHDQIMHTESTRMAQAFFILKSLSIPERCIKDVKTDEFIPEKVPKKRKAFVENISNVTFNDLPNLRRKYQKVTLNQTFLDAGCDVKGNSSSDKVFRFSQEGIHKLQGVYSEPVRETAAPKPKGQWEQLSEETAKKHVLNGGSLLVQGSPGTGKTFYVRQLVKKLREEGKNVDIISKTHNACQNFGENCVTADHWIIRHVKNGSPSCKVLVIDEITQIEIQLWNDFAKVALKDIQFILSGDFKQFQAIAENWCGNPVKEGSLKDSDLLFQLAGGCFLELTENQRSDQILFDFYTGIWEISLEQALEKGRQDFPITKKPANFTLVRSHSKRKR